MTTEPQSAGLDLTEALAAYCHDEQWSGWMQYLFGKCDENPDGTVTIPAIFVARWRRQMDTPYSELPENEKESDRIEARAILALPTLLDRLEHAEAENAALKRAVREFHAAQKQWDAAEGLDDATEGRDRWEKARAKLFAALDPQLEVPDHAAGEGTSNG